MSTMGDPVSGDGTYSYHIDAAPPIRITRRGSDIMHDPLFNKGLAFGLEGGERDRLRLRGLIPPRIMTIEEQMEQFLCQLRDEPDDIKKNVLLEDLHDTNETLYHRVIVDNIEMVAPLIYTPTVGQACEEFAHRFRRPRGMYFTEEDRGVMASMVYNWPRDVEVIVVTDGSRILGLGDLGANGMGIPIGKLALYCAAGGIKPHRVLPVVLDVGTNNKRLLNDPFYLGVKRQRLRGQAFFDVVEEFMAAVRTRWPHVLVQFEDFSSDVAQPLLDMHRDKHLCFNDDIQGTGGTVLAGVMSALRAKGQLVTSLGDERIVIVGAGSAGIGIGQVLKQAMIEQGRSIDNASKAFWVLDQFGDRYDELNQEQKPFVRDEDDKMSLIEVIKKHEPTILLGVTGIGKLFTEDIINELAAHCERPIIFALSNPTDRAECTAEQAYTWTGGKCIFASGSPFPSTTMPDGRILFASQCNNFYLFPGLGLGASVCGSKKVTDRMIYLAAEALAHVTPTEAVKVGKLFPPRDRIRDGSKAIATAVVQEALSLGIATRVSSDDAKDIPGFVERQMYYPHYVPLIEKRTIIL